MSNHLFFSKILMVSSPLPKICLSLLFIFTTITLKAQDKVRNLSGQVVDEMLLPISQATVSLHDH